MCNMLYITCYTLHTLIIVTISTLVHTVNTSVVRQGVVGTISHVVHSSMYDVHKTSYLGIPFKLFYPYKIYTQCFLYTVLVIITYTHGFTHVYIYIA